MKEKEEISNRELTQLRTKLKDYDRNVSAAAQAKTLEDTVSNLTEELEYTIKTAVSTS